MVDGAKRRSVTFAFVRLCEQWGELWVGKFLFDAKGGYISVSISRCECKCTKETYITHENRWTNNEKYNFVSKAPNISLNRTECINAQTNKQKIKTCNTAVKETYKRKQSFASLGCQTASTD